MRRSLVALVASAALTGSACGGSALDHVYEEAPAQAAAPAPEVPAEPERERSTFAVQEGRLLEEADAINELAPSGLVAAAPFATGVAGGSVPGDVEVPAEGDAPGLASHAPDPLRFFRVGLQVAHDSESGWSGEDGEHGEDGDLHEHDLADLGDLDIDPDLEAELEAGDYGFDVSLGRRLPNALVGSLKPSGGGKGAAAPVAVLRAEVTSVSVGPAATGLHPALAEALNRLLAASGGRVWLVSGFRTNEHQYRLWVSAVQRYGSPEAARRWVAPPGSSNHERGLAVDLGGDLGLAARLVEELRLPMWRPMSHEPWHFELYGSRV